MQGFCSFLETKTEYQINVFGKRPPICQNSPLVGCALDEMITAAATTWDLIYRDNIIPEKAAVLDALGRFILVVNVKLGSVSRFQIIGAWIKNILLMLQRLPNNAVRGTIYGLPCSTPIPIFLAPKWPPWSPCPWNQKDGTLLSFYWSHLIDKKGE